MIIPISSKLESGFIFLNQNQLNEKKDLIIF